MDYVTSIVFFKDMSINRIRNKFEKPFAYKDKFYLYFKQMGVENVDKNVKKILHVYDVISIAILVLYVLFINQMLQLMLEVLNCIIYHKIY